MWAIKANVRAPHRYLRMGALCWMVNSNPGGGSDKIEVLAMTRGGHKVCTWVDSRALTNFRPGWNQNRDIWCEYDAKEQAQAKAAQMQSQYGDAPLAPGWVARMKQ